MPRTAPISCAALALLGLSACASDQYDIANAAWAACVNAPAWHECLNEHYAHPSTQSVSNPAGWDVIGAALLSAPAAYYAARPAYQPVFIGCTQNRNVVNCIGK